MLAYFAAAASASSTPCELPLPGINKILQGLIPKLNVDLSNALPEAFGDCGSYGPPTPCDQSGTLWSEETKCVYKASVPWAANFSSAQIVSDGLQLTCDNKTGVYSLGVSVTLNLFAYLHAELCPLCIKCSSIIDTRHDIQQNPEWARGTGRLPCANGNFTGPLGLDDVALGDIKAEIDIGVTTLKIDITGQVGSAVQSYGNSALNAARVTCPFSTTGQQCSLVEALNIATTHYRIKPC